MGSKLDQDQAVRALAPAQLWTSSMSAAADRHTMDTLGMPSPVLMERAALSVSGEVERVARARGARDVLVLIGPGNNGGDGLAVARQLRGRGWEVRAVLVTERHNDAVADQLRVARAHEVEILDELPASVLRGRTIVVDALLGTGSRGAPRGAVEVALRWLEELDRSRVAVVAVDLPSGVDVDSGAVPGVAATASSTVTFQRSKPGLHLTPGRDHVGQIVVADIGLVAAGTGGPAAELIDPRWVSVALAQLPKAAHKGRRGHVGVIGGSGGTPGAAILAGTAALRSGAGLATLAPVDVQTRRALIELRPELMLASAEHAWTIPQADVLVVGPGLVGGDGEALARLDGDDARAMVWDAGGLDEFGPRAAAGPRILTPHPGEAARMLQRLDPGDSLSGWTSARVQSDRLHASSRLAALTGAIVVLKGAGTIVAEDRSGGTQVAICTTGGPALATAGSGDVLAGVVAALLARGLEPWAAACVGVHVHGLAGDLCVPSGALAMDIADAVVPALHEATRAPSSAPSGWPVHVRG